MLITTLNGIICKDRLPQISPRSPLYAPDAVAELELLLSWEVNHWIPSMHTCTHAGTRGGDAGTWTRHA